MNGKRILIGSPIHQNPEILAHFLESLQKLDSSAFSISYFFYDDNSDAVSSQMLQKFQKENLRVKIVVSNEERLHHYIKDDKTHYWQNSNIWRVADMKNNIIRYALKKHIDYLFFVDSDLVLHPQTLNQLTSAKKEIISNVFWTRWQPGTMEMPQVWLMDAYTLYDQKRYPTATEEERYNYTLQFINQLRVPGIYKVGGLGACTLISRRALRKGVNFSEIDSLTIWGEDRHFCIRAQAIGFELFVETTHPAFHIYRDSDLEKVKEYKESCNSNQST